MRRGFLVFCAVIGASMSAQAAGILVPEQGSKATGMAGAFTAVADDASALWYNPAGIAFQPGGRVMVGGDMIIARGRDYVPNPASAPGSMPTLTSSKTHFPPHVYVSYYNEDWPIAFGVGMNSPFRLFTEWPVGAPFAGLGRFAEIQVGSFNPNVAIRFSEGFAVAVGGSYFWVKDFALVYPAQERKGDGDGFGGNAALLYKYQGWSFGASYRSRVTASIAGTAQTKITFPDLVNLGVAYRPLENVQVSLDVDWVNWQTMDSLGLAGASPATLTLNWDSTFTYRLGAEWDYERGSHVRLGYSYDPTPVKAAYFSPLVPESDRHAASLGLGYELGDLNVDLAYMFVFEVEHDQLESTGAAQPLNGTYQSNKLHVVSASLTYRF